MAAITWTFGGMKKGIKYRSRPKIKEVNCDNLITKGTFGGTSFVRVQREKNA